MKKLLCLLGCVITLFAGGCSYYMAPDVDAVATPETVHGYEEEELEISRQIGEMLNKKRQEAGMKPLKFNQQRSKDHLEILRRFADEPFTNEHHAKVARAMGDLMESGKYKTGRITFNHWSDISPEGIDKAYGWITNSRYRSYTEMAVSVCKKEDRTWSVMVIVSK